MSDDVSYGVFPKSPRPEFPGSFSSLDCDYRAVFTQHSPQSVGALNPKALSEMIALVSSVDINSFDEDILGDLVKDINKYEQECNNPEGLFQLAGFDVPDSDDSDSEVPYDFDVPCSSKRNPLYHVPLNDVDSHIATPRSPTPPPERQDVGVLDSSALFSRRSDATPAIPTPTPSEETTPIDEQPKITMSQINKYLLRDPRIKKKADDVMKFTFPDGSTILDACLGTSKYSNPELLAASSAIAAPTASSTDGFKLSDYLIKVMEECSQPQASNIISHDISKSNTQSEIIADENSATAANIIPNKNQDSPESPPKNKSDTKENVAPLPIKEAVSEIKTKSLVPCDLDSPESPPEPLKHKDTSNKTHLVQSQVPQDSPDSPPPSIPHLKTASDIISFVSAKGRTCTGSESVPHTQTVEQIDLTETCSLDSIVCDSPDSPVEITSNTILPQDTPAAIEAEIPAPQTQVVTPDCISDSHITSTSELINSDISKRCNDLINSTQDSPSGSIHGSIESHIEQGEESLESILQKGKLLSGECDTHSFLNKLSVKQLSDLKEILVSNLNPQNVTNPAKKDLVDKARGFVKLMGLQNSDSESVKSSSSLVVKEVRKSPKKASKMVPDKAPNKKNEKKASKSPAKEANVNTLKKKSKDQSNSAAPVKKKDEKQEDVIICSSSSSSCSSSSSSSSSDDEDNLSLVKRVKRTTKESAKISIQNKNSSAKANRKSSPTRREQIVRNKRHSRSPLNSNSNAAFIRKQDRSFNCRKERNYRTSSPPRRSKSPYRQKYVHTSRKSSPLRRRRSPVERRRSRSPRRSGLRCRSTSPLKRALGKNSSPPSKSNKRLSDVPPPRTLAPATYVPELAPFGSVCSAPQLFNNSQPRPFHPVQPSYYEGYTVNYQPPPPQPIDQQPPPPGLWPWDGTDYYGGSAPPQQYSYQQPWPPY